MENQNENIENEIPNTNDFILSRLDKTKLTYFERIEESVTESIYGVVYILLKDDEGIPHFLEYILLILEFFQFWAFSFNSSVAMAWNDTGTSVRIFNVLNAPNFTDYLHNSSTIAYIVTFYFCVLLVLLVALNIIYISISFNRKYFTVTWPLYILRYIAKFILTIFFMPLFGKYLF